jgi:uncharacterized protein (DUF983 family)
MQAREEPSNRHWRRYLARVLARRCPRCGEGQLFRSYFRLAERCSRCTLVYRREQGGMTGQMYLSAAVTQLFAAALVLAVFAGTDWGPGLSIAVLVPPVLLFSYWFLPKAMALWVAIEFMTDVSNREPWIFGEERDG